MCLAIPGQILELCDDRRQVALVEISGVRRRINVELLEQEPLGPGDWVLILGLPYDRPSTTTSATSR